MIFLTLSSIINNMTLSIFRTSKILNSYKIRIYKLKFRLVFRKSRVKRLQAYYNNCFYILMFALNNNWMIRQLCNFCWPWQVFWKYFWRYAFLKNKTIIFCSIICIQITNIYITGPRVPSDRQSLHLADGFFFKLPTSDRSNFVEFLPCNWLLFFL